MARFNSARPVRTRPAVAVKNAPLSRSELVALRLVFSKPSRPGALVLVAGSGLGRA
ncbi:MAG: hypothetical protein AVDCRST_MAG88-581 [uncultured Thermomicrobiales bacterium]|uniref:Uncharacterized protein n=1 Tax=uncultured Thermomicrobiales bacterium TaxID=1645740 RepID=A0A6J4UEH9_9BACT|nr:MAG: hypothetical protein AVDCRST_MAG88-581 [uncultured Thermomicrobiales bacterium]